MHARDLAAHEPKPPRIRPHHPRPDGAAAAGRPAPGGHAASRRPPSSPPAPTRARTFTAAGDFNTVAVALTNPGSPLRGSVPVTATAASDRGITSVVFSTAPAGTGTWTVACTKTVAPYTCTLRHDDGRRRAARRARRGDRQRRLLAHLDRHQPPRRQHRADRDDDRSRLAADRHRHRRRQRRRRRLRSRQRGARVPLDDRRVDQRSARRRPRRSRAPGTRRARRRALRPADGRHRRGRQPDDLGAGLQPPRRQHRADRLADRSRHAAEGTITLASTTGDGAGSGVSSVRYEYKLGAGAWTTACTGATTPFSCTFNTGSVADGLYDFRAIATDGVGQGHDLRRGHRAPDRQRSPDGRHARRGRRTDPEHRPTDRHRDRPRLRRRLAALPVRARRHGRWTDVCTDPRSRPTPARSTRRAPPTALYDLRTLATDNAGNTTASADADQPHARQQRPRRRRSRTRAAGASVRGTVSASTARRPTSPASPRSTFQYRAGAATWTTLCTDTTSPYSCAAQHDDARRRLLRTSPPRRRPTRSPSTTTTSPVTVYRRQRRADRDQRAGHQRRYRRRPRRGRRAHRHLLRARCPPSRSWPGGTAARPPSRCTSITPAASTPSTSMTPRTQRRRTSPARRSARRGLRVDQRHVQRDDAALSAATSRSPSAR